MDPCEQRASWGVWMSAVVETQRLTKRFGADRGINEVSFEVGSVRCSAFSGPTAPGSRRRSGYCSVCTGRPPARCGSSTSIRTRDTVEIHRRVGYLPGELALYPRLTGRQHLDRFARIRGHDRDSLPRRIGRTVRRGAERPMRTLSKGNRQKIGLVLAFMHRPDLLVLDEPTAGLDPLLQDEFARLVRETVAERPHRIPVLARTRRGPAPGRPARDHQGGPHRGHRHRRRAAQQCAAHNRVRIRRPSRSRRFAGLTAFRCCSDDGARVTLSVTGPVAPVLRIAADAGCGGRRRAASRSGRTVPAATTATNRTDAGPRLPMT